VDIFTPSGEDLGTGAIAMAAGDLDGDTDIDLIFGNGDNRVYLNNGDGTYSFSYSFSDNSAGHARCLRLGDLDGDRDFDLVEGIGGYPSGYPDTEVRVYINDGTGVFGAPTSVIVKRAPVMYYDGSQFVTLGDVDRDGDTDVVVSWRDTSQAEVYTNDGSGNFQLSQTIASTYVKASALGDLDGDSDVDMVLANSEGYPNKVFLNDGLGTFLDSGQALGSSYTYHVGLGDLDKDGDLDLITANIAAEQRVFRNDGWGMFSLWHTLGASSGYSHPVLIEDIDNDNDLDAITAGDSTCIYLNDGFGQLSGSGQVLPGTSGLNGDARLLDADGDGDLDLCTAGYPNALYYNVTDPTTFSLAVTPDPLQGGQNGLFAVTGGIPNRPAWLAYSLQGPGSTFISPLNVTVDLLNPRRGAGPTGTNSQGDVSWTLMVPSVLPGLSVWFQAVQYAQASNVAATTIQ